MTHFPKEGVHLPFAECWGMDDALSASLRRAGWRPSEYKGFLHSRRAGIDFHAGRRAGATEAAVELRYRYDNGTTVSEGDVALEPDADLARIEDAMTGIYLRIHDKPDPRRVFGSGRRGRPAPSAPIGRAPAPEPEPAQETLDL